MRGKHLLLSLIITSFLVIGARAGEIQKVSPDIATDTLTSPPFTYPPIFENENIQPLIINDNPQAGVALVPETSTVSMVLFGFSLLGGVALLRKSRKA